MTRTGIFIFYKGTYFSKAWKIPLTAIVGLIEGWVMAFTGIYVIAVTYILLMLAEVYTIYKYSTRSMDNDCHRYINIIIRLYPAFERLFYN